MYENAHPPFTMRATFFAQQNTTIQFPLYYNPRLVLAPSGQNAIIGLNWIWSGNAALCMTDNDGSNISTDRDVFAQIFGTDPHCSMVHEFGILNDPSTYFDPTMWKEVQLVLTQASAGAVKIVLKQLRPLA